MLFRSNVLGVARLFHSLGDKWAPTKIVVLKCIRSNFVMRIIALPYVVGNMRMLWLHSFLFHYVCEHFKLIVLDTLNYSSCIPPKTSFSMELEAGDTLFFNCDFAILGAGAFHRE